MGKLIVSLSLFIFASVGFANPQNPKPVYGPPDHSPGIPLGYNDGNRSGSNCKNTDLNANAKLVMNFYQDLLGDKKGHLLEQYLAIDYINHSPFSSAVGREDFRQLLQGPLTQAPQQKINFRRVNPVDDVVWTHSSWDLGGKTYSAMDIFKINCAGLIQEHWDVIQDINVPTKNPQPFF